MAKILGSWSGMRVYLEREMAAPSLQGRVRYDCTSYTGMDGCRIFRFYLDDREIKRFSLETVNDHFRSSAPKGDGYWDGFWPWLWNTPVTARTEYTDAEFCNALAAYRNQSIAASLASDHPLIFLFALLDRRVGKRTLRNLESSMATRPTWLQEVYQFRCAQEFSRDR